MSEEKVPRSVEQRIVIKFLVGENVPSAEIHHRLQQQYGEEFLRRRSHSCYTVRLVYTKSVPVIFEPLCIRSYSSARCLREKDETKKRKHTKAAVLALHETQLRVIISSLRELFQGIRFGNTEKNHQTK